VTKGPDDFVVCCDLDGVIWRGEHAIPGAAAGVAKLRDAGLRVVFLTNNSSGRVRDYVARLERAGISAVSEGDVGSSAQAAAALLATTLPAGARVLPCAGDGVVEAVEAAGFVVVDREPADAVVVGWHSTFNFERLRLASDAIRAGARYVATNLDPTYPGAEGLLPGAGSIAAAVTTASGCAPDVAGKPHPPMVSLVRSRFGARGVMVGDRPSTDGALATALDWPFALVLSGVAGAQGEEAVPDPAPPFVAADLGDLAPRLVKTFARA
jgi:HAD superfamily hydrolase (TIGR01450 family)